MCTVLPDFDELYAILEQKYFQVNFQLSNGRKYNRGLLVLLYLKLRFMLILSQHPVDRKKDSNPMFDNVDYLITLTNLIKLSNGELIALPDRVINILNYFKIFENNSIPQYVLDFIKDVIDYNGFKIVLNNPFPNPYPNNFQNIFPNQT